MFLGTKKIILEYTPDLPKFLEKEMLKPEELYRKKKEASERRKEAILRSIAKQNREVDEYNATHEDKKGYTAYLDMGGGAKLRAVSRYPYVIENNDYIIEKDQAFPIYDSNRRCVGNGFAFEMKELEYVNVGNVFEIYERDLNNVVKFDKNTKEWKHGTRKNRINPVPENPIKRLFVKRALLNAYNNTLPIDEKYPVFRRILKMGEFIAVSSFGNENKNRSDGWHYILPRTLCGTVIEDEMDGDYGPQIEANIVPQIKILSEELVNYPMIDFESPSFFGRYPKGLVGENIREKEALDRKLGRLPCAAYNYLDRHGIIKEMKRSIDDKYEKIRIARTLKK